MDSVTTNAARLPLLKRSIAALLLLAFLGLNAVAASAFLHEHVHHGEANKAGHHCVFVQVSNGQCMADAPPVAAPAPLVIGVFTVSTVVTFVLPSRAFALLPGRAPPFSLA